MSKLWYINQQRTLGGAAAGPWYLAGGIPAANCLAVYLPHGAASLATSYIDLINPGVGDIVPQVAPTFDPAIGWISAGAAWLQTPIFATCSCVIVRLSGVTVNGVLIGETQGDNYVIQPCKFDGFVGYGPGGLKAPLCASGVLAATTTRGYRDGVDESACDWAGAKASNQFTVFGRNGGAEKLTGNVQFLALYTTLTAAQITAVSALNP